jgi:hypothetical protein
VSETIPSEIDQTDRLPTTLCGYYTNPGLKPRDFLRAVRAAKVKAFQPSDLESARASLAENDPDLTRTLALGLGTRGPEPIERWVVDTTIFALRSIDPEILLPENASAEAAFQRILEELAAGLQSSKKPIRSRAHNLVKLSLNWLIQRRSLDPLRALYAFRRFPGKAALRDGAHGEAQKVLLRAKPNQWRTLSVVASLSQEEVKEADRSRNQALQARDQLQMRFDELEQQVASKSRDLARVLEELHGLKGDLDAAEREVEAQRRLRELDAAEAAGRTRNLLVGRLGLLLSDARDALEFEPPQVEAARQRIEAARETIVREVKNPNG